MSFIDALKSVFTKKGRKIKQEESEIKQKLSALQNKDHGKPGDNEIRLDIIGIEYSHSFYRH